MEANDQPAIPLGIAPDGTLSASTPHGTLVIELSGAFGAEPEVVTSMQPDIASPPKVIARYPLRQFLARVLRAFRSGRGKRSFNALAVVPRVPGPLRRAMLFALVQFARVNYKRLMLIAHARRPRAQIQSTKKSGMKFFVPGLTAY
jgi:hypothetical protein